jgi:hypothetical protein
MQRGLEMHAVETSLNDFQSVELALDAFLPHFKH